MIDRLNAALEGRYRAEELVGRGGMATVYRAVDLRHERTVAIKVMNPEFAATVGRERFLREIRVTAGLSHPHILTLHDSGDVDGALFYVMPFVEGVSLRQRLAMEPGLSHEELRKIVREVADALSYAKGRAIVHRDIKPENILLAGFVPGAALASWNTLVADFGIAVPETTQAEHLTGTGIAVGSPQYMSPEQALGERVDHRTDVYALGCVAYEMLEGSPPRGVPTLTTSGATAIMRRAVLKALAVNPAERFADAREFAEALAGREPRLARHARTLLFAGVAGLVAVAALASIALRPSHRVPRGLTSDTVALRLYQQARANHATLQEPRVAEAVAQYSAALQRDSGFTLAWSGLARSAQYAVMRGYRLPGRSPDSLLALALVASRRAVALDSGLSDVWLVRARVMESMEPTSRLAVLSDLRRALAADSMNGDAWFALGRAREEGLDSAGARAAYERAVTLAPTHLELMAFFALHYLWSGEWAKGMRWADSGVALDPTHQLSRDAAMQLAIQLRDWPAAERHLLAFRQIARGPDRVISLAHASLLSLARGNRAEARRLAQAAAQAADSVALTKHVAAYLSQALAAVGDTAGAVRWLSAFTPRGDMHFQLHLHRDPGLSWLYFPRYRFLLSH